MKTHLDHTFNPSVTRPNVLLRTQSAALALVVGTGLLLACSKEPSFDTKPNDQGAGSPTAGAAEGDASRPAETPPNGSPAADSGADSPLKDALALPQDVNSFLISKQDQDLSNLECQRTFELKALSPDGSAATSQIRWLSSDSSIIRIDDSGKATVVGSGKVKLIAVSKGNDGQEIQDNIEIDVPPALSGYAVSMSEGIKNIMTAQRNNSGGSDVFKDGLAKGKIRIDHPESNISIGRVDATVHSTDFKNFVFSSFSKPTLEESKCTWFVEFSLEFNNLFVGAVTSYGGQNMTVTFDPTTNRQPFTFNWTATLIPEGQSGDLTPVNSGTGTQGFSPAPK